MSRALHGSLGPRPQAGARDQIHGVRLSDVELTDGDQRAALRRGRQRRNTPICNGPGERGEARDVQIEGTRAPRPPASGEPHSARLGWRLLGGLSALSVSRLFCEGLGTLAAAITLLTAAPCSAETFMVTTNGDTTHSCTGGSCTTIRAALTAALNNGAATEDRSSCPRTYQLGSELPVDSRCESAAREQRTTAIRGNRPASGAPGGSFDIAAVQATIESLRWRTAG